MAVNEGDEPFQWDVLVPHTVHPCKVGIIEALLWIDRPLSAIDVSRLFDEEVSHMLVSYHLGKLAEFGILAIAEKRPTRGGSEHFYFFAAREGESA